MNSYRIAMLPGSFDPPTNGHIDIILRAAKLYDSLYVVVADNAAKKSLFSAQQRKSMLEETLKGEENITVTIYGGLMINFCREHKVGVMIRGVRALADFGYEFELSQTNKQLAPDIETLFIPTSPKYFILRSSAIKEMALFGADISNLVPPVVAREMAKKIARKRG